ncbi:Crossover junction endonuclease mus81 [Thecaphora frezii]
MAPPPPPSNALWLTFIAAWRDEAQARGSKAAQTYHKAYKSLSACPIPFQHPCQTTQLVGIGPTIASRLEQELRKWCDENGEAMPERPAAAPTTKKAGKGSSAGVSKPSKTSASAASSNSKSHARSTREDADGPSHDDRDDDDGNDDDDDSSGDEAAATAGHKRRTAPKPKNTAPKKPRTATKKPYVPQFRSGGYGLLLGLFSKTHPGEGGQEVYMSKAELVEAAQPYSDSDYINGSGGSRTTASASIALPAASQALSSRSAPRSFYSAWNSMKTLIGKGYVYQTGNPPKFCLSEEGFAVAETMAKEAGVKQSAAKIGDPVAASTSKQGSGTATAAATPATTATVPAPTTIATVSTRPMKVGSLRRTSSDDARQHASKSSAFRYAYLTADALAKPVLSRSDAAQKPSRSGNETCYHIRFPRACCGHKIVAHHVEMIEEDESALDMLTGYLVGAKANLVAPGLRGTPSDISNSRTTHDVTIAVTGASSDSETEAVEGPALRQCTATATTTLTAASASTVGPQRRVSRLSNIVPAPAAKASWHSRLLPPPRTSSTANNSSGSGTETSTERHRQTAVRRISDSVSDGPSWASDLDENEPDDAAAGGPPCATAEDEPLSAAAIPEFEPIKMPRGSFTIHFILDNRERRHSRDAHGKVSLAGALEGKGVEVEVRALELGDAIWVARRKDGGGAEGDEVVLDFVVERKRLDDLTSSILDGRWKDQKFRLSSSGLSQVVYLIEDHDVDNQMRRFGEQIQTALSSTQVVDGFFVERTAGLDASIEHLARMDRMVRAMYKDAELTILPDCVVSRSSYTQLQGQLRAARPDVTYLTTFAAYQSLNGKSASLTLRDVFGKMLLCIRGMSAEKVREMLELWQTPRELWEAYEELEKREGEAAASSMLSSLVNPPEQRKKVGPALSAKTHGVFRSTKYRDSS